MFSAGMDKSRRLAMVMPHFTQGHQKWTESLSQITCEWPCRMEQQTPHLWGPETQTEDTLLQSRDYWDSEGH